MPTISFARYSYTKAQINDRGLFVLFICINVLKYNAPILRLGSYMTFKNYCISRKILSTAKNLPLMANLEKKKHDYAAVQQFQFQDKLMVLGNLDFLTWCW